jgi:Tfp pilus assembly protein PilE
MPDDHKPGFLYSHQDLVILLVVVGLLAILIYPALQRAKAMANRTSCKSNLSCLAAAMIVYSTEHNGNFPHLLPDRSRPASVDDASRAMGMLYRSHHVENAHTFQCPSSLGDASLIDRVTGIPDRRATSYGYDPTHKANDPGTVAILADSWSPGSVSANHYEGPWGWGAIIMHAAFVDSHVETISGPPFTVNIHDFHKPEGSRDDIFTENQGLITDPRPDARKYDSFIMGGINDTRP